MPDMPVIFKASFGDLIAYSKDSMRGMLRDSCAIIFIVFTLVKSGKIIFELNYSKWTF